MTPKTIHPVASESIADSHRTHPATGSEVIAGQWAYHPILGSLAFSKQFRIMLGLSDHEFPNKLAAWRGRVHPDDRLLSLIALRNHLRRGHPLDFQQRILVGNGAYRWFRVQGISCRNAAGELEQIVGTLTEFPDQHVQSDELNRLGGELAWARKRIEAQSAKLDALSKELARSRVQAETSNLSKREFLSNVSHEIRTPITAILGYVDLLANHNGSDFIGFRQAVNSIHRNASQLMTVVDDILEMSSLEAGQSESSASSISPVDFVREVAAWFVPRAEEKGLSLIVHCESDLPAEISTDPVRLRQILFNLVGNAIKFTERGTVQLVASLRHTHKDVRFCLEVRDTGIGLKAEQLRTLFRPFTPGDGSPSRGYGGNGLGLALASRLARLLQGELEVESTPQQGSCFRLVIPVLAILKTEPPPSPVDPPRKSESAIPVNLPSVPNSIGKPFRESLAARSSAGEPPAADQRHIVDVRSHRSRNSSGSRVPSAARLDGTKSQSSRTHESRPRDLPREPASDESVSDASEVDTVFLGPVAARATPTEPTDAQDGIDTVMVPPAGSRAVNSNASGMAGMTHAGHPSISSPRIQQASEPVRGATSASAPVKRTRNEFRKNCRVLVADDGPDNLRLMTFMLERLGMQVVTAENGKLARDAAWLAMEQGSPFDVVLMDMQMPVLDGYAATRQLRKEGYHRPIVAITASSMKADRDRCLQAGCDDFASKPIDRERLLDVISRWVESPASFGAKPS